MSFDWAIKNKYSVILLIQKSFLKVLTPTTCKRVQSNLPCTNCARINKILIAHFFLTLKL